MPEDTIVGGVLSIIRFFERIGTSLLSRDSDIVIMPQGTDVLLQQDQTPLALRLIHEVKTGWSFQTIDDFWGQLLPLTIFFCLVFSASIAYCCIRVFQIRRMEYAAWLAGTKTTPQEEVPKHQLRWQRIQEQVTSDDANQWRTAILEADQMLNELLDNLGYKGETMGEKLRKADVAAFNTIDFAWEAHQVRNRLTQDTAFVLEQREARRVINMYERVFKEFKFISLE